MKKVLFCWGINGRNYLQNKECHQYRICHPNCDRQIGDQFVSRLQKYLKSILISWLVNCRRLICPGQDGSLYWFDLSWQGFKWRWHWHNCIIIWWIVTFWVTACVDNLIFPILNITISEFRWFWTFDLLFAAIMNMFVTAYCKQKPCNSNWDWYYPY